MSSLHARSLSRIFTVGFMLLLVGLVLGVQSLPVANAGFTSCRADPIVVLSNGAQIRMTADIATDPTNVSMIVYRLHAPAGTRITNLVYTGGAFSGKEQVLFYADLAVAKYSTDTFVTLTPNIPGVDVTAFTQVSTNSATTSGSISKSPGSGQHLIVNLQAN